MPPASLAETRAPVPRGTSAHTADALVVFGLTGDLGRRMTIPALYRLARGGWLPCDVVGVGRRDLTSDALRRLARGSVEEAEDGVDEETFARFAKRLTYVAGDVADPRLFERLRSVLGEAQHPLFYLAVPPSLFSQVVELLRTAGLTEGARVVFEKPFGHDLASARTLNEDLHTLLDEEQIYRIDHFLGKEPVQDIVYLRFANELFEPIWNRNHIESVQITLAESFDVADRGSFYDEVGALRDVVQNHLLQVLALVAMEPPAGGREAVSDRKLDVLRAIPPVDPSAYVRGQYAGYRDTLGVRPDSDTETFAALRLWIRSWRWSSVPFLIRAGKAMATTSTEVDIVLRKPPPILLTDELNEVAHHNHITIRIGEDAGASLGILVKDAVRDRAEPVHLDLSFAEHVGRGPGPYERLLGDALMGDGALFPNQATVEEMWRIVQPLLDDPPSIHVYERGSWGPVEADRLARDHGGWRGAPN